MKSINPFDDPEFKKLILGDEVLGSEMAEIIDSVPTISDTASTLIVDASALAKTKNEQKAQEITLALNNVFSEYNKKYDLDLNIDFSSMSRTLINVADPKKRHVLELYLSEVFKSIKPILILNLISKLTLIIDTILEPNKLFNSELSVSDLFIVIEKLLQYIDQLEAMKKDVIIPGADLELKKIAEEQGDTSIDSLENREAVEEFMRLFRNEQHNGE